MDFYFIQDDGGSFKATVPFEPYFFVGCRAGSETQVEEWLVKKYEGLVIRTERRKKWDLSLVSCLPCLLFVPRANPRSCSLSSQIICSPHLRYLSRSSSTTRKTCKPSEEISCLLPPSIAPS